MNRLSYCYFLVLVAFLSGCKNETEDPVEEVLPFLAIQNTSQLEGDADTQMTFSLRLFEAANGDVSIRYATEAGSATAGEDFTAIPESNLTIPAGETDASIEVTILGDTNREGDETFTLVLTEVTGAQISNPSATGTIRNDDEADGSGSIDDTGYISPTSYAGYNLVWEDEFEGTSLNLSDWTYEFGDGCPNLCGWGNNELQTYTDQNTEVREGYLIIEARQENVGGSNYTSSRIISKNKQSFEYGRIDIRAKMPFGDGMWPALWMLGDNIDNVGWPRCGEIDIMEMVGFESEVVHGTCHWANEAGNREQFGGSRRLSSGILHDNFHVYSIIWDADGIRWLFDNSQYHAIDTRSDNLDEFRNSFFFIFNIAVGGDWPGPPNATTLFPQQMIVDYVRVFQPQ